MERKRTSCVAFAKRKSGRRMDVKTQPICRWQITHFPFSATLQLYGTCIFLMPQVLPELLGRAFFGNRNWTPLRTTVFLNYIFPSFFNSSSSFLTYHFVIDSIFLYTIRGTLQPKTELADEVCFISGYLMENHVSFPFKRWIVFIQLLTQFACD